MRLTFLLIVLLLPLLVLAQKKTPFTVKTIEIDKKAGRKLIKDLEKEKGQLYEDENYTVKSFCRGEFGGAVRFKNKKTGKEYQCRATCAVNINRLNGRYYITNFLGHMAGRSQVLEVKDPDNLSPVSPSSKIYLIDEREYLSDDDMNTITKRGVKELVDSLGFFTLGSFPFSGKLYHIVIDREKTFVAEVKDKKYVPVQILAEKRAYSLAPEVIKAAENRYIMEFFNLNNEAGHIDIFEDQITLYFYK